MTEPVDTLEKLRAENEKLLSMREQVIQLRAALDSMIRNVGEDSTPGVRALSLANARVVLRETAPEYVGTTVGWPTSEQVALLVPTALELEAEAEYEAEEAAFWGDFYELDEGEGGAA